MSKSSRFDSDSFGYEENPNRKTRRRVRQILEELIDAEIDPDDVDEIYVDESPKADRKGLPKPKKDKGWNRITTKRAFIDEES